MKINHDEGYKRFFTHPKMVKDQLEGFVDAQWVKSLDFETLEKVNSEFITDKKLKRHASDVIWKVRHQIEDQWFYIYLLLEFQSKPDPSMPLHVMVYTGMLYLELYETKQFIKDPKTGYPQLPPILPLVLYNGKTRWNKALDVSDLIIESPLGLEPFRPHMRYLLIDEGQYKNHELAELRNLVAALFQFENSCKEDDIYEVLARLGEWLKTPQQEGLQRTFSVWLNEILFPSRFPNVIPPNINSFEKEGTTMLAETVKGWYDEAEAKGEASRASSFDI